MEVALSQLSTPHEEAVRLLTLVSEGVVLEATVLDGDPWLEQSAPDDSSGAVVVLDFERSDRSLNVERGNDVA